MILTYPPHHRWLKATVKEPELLYGPKNSKRIRSTLLRIQDFAITHDIRPLDQDFLAWFVPMYEATIGGKKNAVVHDIYNSTLGNKESLSEYWCLSLYENGQPIGGTIIGIRSDRIMIVYRVYNQKWSSGSLQANPSLYTEYLVSSYAYNLGKSFVSHGKDRNPYGLNANIGLATFKLSVGCKAYIATDNDDYAPLTLDTDSLDTDALILHHPENGEEITKATLVTTKAALEKYGQLLHYPNLLKVEVIYRD